MRVGNHVSSVDSVEVVLKPTSQSSHEVRSRQLPSRTTQAGIPEKVPALPNAASEHY